MGGGGLKSPKKMIKTVRKLRKLWSRKKKKNKSEDEEPSRPYSYYSCHYQQQHHLIISPQPLQYHHHHHPHSSCTTPEPSAPPLPPWLDFHPQPEPWLENREEIAVETSPLCPAVTVKEIVVETSPSCPTVTVNVEEEQQQVTSCEEYLDPNPDPVSPNLKRKRRSGMLVTYGIILIHCLFSCFRIREEDNCKEERKKLLQ